MTATKLIIACKVFADELLYVLKDKEEVEIIWLDAALHADLPRLEHELTGVLAAIGEKQEEGRLFMGVGCHPDIVKLARKFGVPFATVKNCLEAFLGSRVKELEQDRTMLMTPGWIRAWPGIMASLGWNEVDVRINLGRYNRILLLEPGINPLNDEEILAFFDLVQVPIEVEPLDLTHFRSALAELLDGPGPSRQDTQLTVCEDDKLNNIEERGESMILVINGSPKPQGNLHRMVEKVARDTGQPYEMVRLATLNIRPCLGCVKCADTNRCVQNDDMALLYDKIVAADALIVGPVVYFGKANAFTHTFLERLFPLRHVEPQTIGKLAAVVCVGGDEAEQVVRDLSYQLNSYFEYKVVGSVFFNSATPPCFICGYGTTCQYGGPARWMDPEAFAQFNEIAPEMFQNFEDHPEVVAACELLSRELKTAIDSLS